MEHLLVKVPADQVAFVAQLLGRLSLEVENLSTDENLTAEQIEMLREGIRQADAGEVVTFEELKAEAEQWLTK